MVWKFAEPFLFPVIGASVCLTEISPSLLFTSMICVVFSILVKMTFAFLVANVAGLSSEEQLFTCGLWSGKASVQVCNVAIMVDCCFINS